ncbi:carboxypeptidase-like regulatory domain-containing protein [Flavobacterium sp. F-65]|uniref:Carboxypeptidase-like regulatory domain-containing protein n=1 Tax=Flavobacterium pisciphilum TaxID=2893755 RepID=A0ABS8MX74_9FLAO|nr:carboxypeptidase-like regulatory domain-containing protein [Flavobacterium sp. F-65]MCC9073381.1 carboxypeptidase-like regulatory domain-containing protein [Flavobacterium sp. F-65]
MKKLILIFTLLPFFSIAQGMKGIVFSKKNNLPIENTNVFALSSKVGTITNLKGEFTLNIDPKFADNEVIEFSHIGYTTTRFSLSYLINQHLNIFLEEDIQNLSGVTIIANPNLKSKLPFNKLSPSKKSTFSFGSFLKDGKIHIVGGEASFKTDQLAKGRAQKADYNLTDYLKDAGNNPKFLYYRGNYSIYNTKTDTWEFTKTKLKKRAYHNIHYYNNSIYVLGGKRMFVNKETSWEYLEDKIEVFDIEKQTIKIDNTNPHQAVNFASFVYNDNIIVMGGSVKMTDEGKKDFTNKVHLYNIPSGYWYELTNMPIAKEATGILIDNKIYLIGGDNGKPMTSIETFDLVTEKWQTEGELFSGLLRPAIATDGNMIYVFENQIMYTYDLKSKQLKEYEINLDMKYSAMYYDNNKLYVLGGLIEKNFTKKPSDDVFSIDISDFKTTKPNKTKTLSQGVSFAKTNENPL